MLIEIASTEPPPEGKKMGKVAGAMGESLYAWPNIIEKLKVGSRYEIEIEESDFNGRPFRKIKKVKPAVASAKAGDNVIPMQRGNGAAPPASSHDAEMAFVRELLAVAVRTGAVAFSAHDLRAAITLLRTLWREQSGK